MVRTYFIKVVLIGTFTLLVRPILSMADCIYHAKKGDQEVLIIGAEQFDGLKAERDCIFGRLRQLADEKEQTLCLVPESRENISVVVHENTKSAQETLSLNRAYLQFAHDNSYALNNLIFDCRAFTQSADEQCWFFPTQLNKAEHISQLLAKFSNLAIKIDQWEYMLKDRTISTWFFSDKGPFVQLKSHFRKQVAEVLRSMKAQPISMKEYLELLRNEVTKIENSLDTIESDVLKKYLIQLKDKLDRNISNAQSFIATFSDINKQPLEICFDLIHNRKSLIQASSDINKNLMPCLSALIHARISYVLIELFQKYKRIFHINRSILLQNIPALLKALGFTVTEYGNTKPVVGELMLFADGSKIPLQEVQGIMGSFGSTSLDLRKSETRQPPQAPDKYYNTQTDSIQETPMHDQSYVQCSTCKEQFQGVLGFIRGSMTAYCTFPCFLQGLVAQKRALELLIVNRPWTVQEQEVLLKVAGLCELQKLMFSSTPHDDKGQAFLINHEERIEVLSKLSAYIESKTGVDHQTFQKAVELAQDLDITLRSISAFHKLFKMHKDGYRKRLLEAARNYSYAFLSFASPELFDPELKMHAYQGALVSSLQKSFHCHETTAHTFYRIYQEIARHILHKLGKKTQDAYYALHIDKLPETRSLESLLLALKYIPDEKEENSCDDEIEERQELQEEPAQQEGESIKKTALLPLQTKNQQQIFLKKPKLVKPYVIYQSSFGTTPYFVTLFRAQHYVSNPDIKAQSAWRSCNSFREALRIKTLFALEGTASEQRSGEDANILLGCPQNAVDATLIDKIDLHHLFCRAVDHSCYFLGIAETIENLIQISIPGSITLASGETSIGFFQYSFIPTDQWILVHRCFKNYKKQSYISDRLRQTLLAYLKAQPVNYFNDAIKTLEKMMQP